MINIADDDIQIALMLHTQIRIQAVEYVLFYRSLN